MVWYSLGDGRYRGPGDRHGRRAGSRWSATSTATAGTTCSGTAPAAIPDRQWQGRANRTVPLGRGDHERHLRAPGRRRLQRRPGRRTSTGTTRARARTSSGGAPRSASCARNANMGGDYEPFPGDFDGDFKDDIFWYGPGAAPATGSGSARPTASPPTTSTTPPTASRCPATTTATTAPTSSGTAWARWPTGSGPGRSNRGFSGYNVDRGPALRRRPRPATSTATPSTTCSGTPAPTTSDRIWWF